MGTICTLKAIFLFRYQACILLRTNGYFIAHRISTSCKRYEKISSPGRLENVRLIGFLFENEGGGTWSESQRKQLIDRNRVTELIRS